MVHVCQVIELMKWCMCVRWLSWWNGACVSGDWGYSICSQVQHWEVSVSTTDGQCITVHCWVVYKCKASRHSAAADVHAGRHWSHNWSLTSHEVRLITFISVVIIYLFTLYFRRCYTPQWLTLLSGSLASTVDLPSQLWRLLNRFRAGQGLRDHLAVFFQLTKTKTKIVVKVNISLTKTKTKTKKSIKKRKLKRNEK